MKRIRIDRRGTRRESPWLEDLPTRGRAARPPGLASPGPAGMFDERRQLLPVGLGVLGGQIDLILRRAEGEVDGHIGWAATEVVFQRDDYSPGVARRGLAAMSTVRRDRGCLPGTFGGWPEPRLWLWTALPCGLPPQFTAPVQPIGWLS